MAELRKFLDQEGVGTLWEKIDEKFADAESTLAIFEAIGNELDELAAAQADWNQNDETAKDYVKNRTHYIEEIENVIVPIDTYETSYKGLYYGTEFDNNIGDFDINKQYKVTLNGKEYMANVKQADLNYMDVGKVSGLYLGNLKYSYNIFNSLDNNNSGETFFITVKNNKLCFRSEYREGTISFGLGSPSQSVVQLDEKFIPDTIARISDINNGVGQTTEEGGEIFNDYENNRADYFAHAEGQFTYALSEAAHAEGSHTLAEHFASHAEGYQTTASGYTSHAEGQQTLAEGSQAHAEGLYTIARGNVSHAEGELTIVYSTGSHAEGKSTKAGGDGTTEGGSYAHAEGVNTIAMGRGSHAEGEGTQSSGQYSHAEGGGCTAKGDYSHAEGCNDNRGYAVDAVGMASHAEGRGTQAKAEASHAEGISTMAEGKFSHVEGEWSFTGGQGAHAEGYDTKAKGNYSHAEGYQTSAQGNNTHAEGRLTFAVSREAHAEGDSTVAGNGTIDTSNLSPLADYGAGASAHAEGIGSFARGGASHSEGYKTQATGEASHAEGKETVASVGSAHAEGEYTEANGISSHAEGHNTRTEGFYNHAEGTYTLATGYGAHAEGRGDITKSVVASGQGSHAEGYKTEASGSFSHAEGEETIASGKDSHAEGGYSYLISPGAAEEIYMTSYTFTDPADTKHIIVSTIAMGSAAHAEGLQTVAYGYGAHAEGWRTAAAGSCSHAEGVGAMAEGESSHAEGMSNIASGRASHAEGSQNEALGLCSHAEGYRTIAKADYQHVQGRYNLSGTYAMAIGNGTPSKASNAMEVDWNGNAKFSGDVVAYNTSYSLSKIGSDYSLRNHAYTTTGHGLGSETLYGHVKLTDELDLMEWYNHNDLLNAKNGTAATPNAVLRVLKEARQPGLIKARGTNTNISLPASVITPVPMTTVITYSEVYNAESNKTDKFEISNGREGKDAPAGGIVCPVNGWVMASGHVYFNSTVNQARKGAYLMFWRMDSKTSEEACSQYICEERSSQGRATTGSSIIEVASGDIIYLCGRSNVDRICDAQGSTLNVHYIAKDY